MFSAEEGQKVDQQRTGIKWPSPNRSDSARTILLQPFCYPITLSRSQTYGTEFEELYHFQQYLWYKLELQMPNKLLKTEKMEDAVELEAEMFMSMMGLCKMQVKNEVRSAQMGNSVGSIQT
jgi:hypothetical protein